MTHMYVMQERKNSTLEDSADNEIQVNVEPEMSSVSTSIPLDLLGATESINDNIIFDTSEIFPVKAPEEEEDITEGRTNIAAVSRIEDPKSSLELELELVQDRKEHLQGGDWSQCVIYLQLNGTLTVISDNVQLVYSICFYKSNKLEQNCFILVLDFAHTCNDLY